MKMRLVAVGLVWSFTGAFAQPEAKPQYGAWGFDSEGADLKARPGDDFFRYANGAWLDRVQIPGDKPAYSLRLAMTDLTEQRLHDLLEEAAKKAEPKPATVEGKVGAFYKSFMDEAAVEKAGPAPLKSKLVEIQSARTREALAAVMGRQNSDFHGGIFGIYVDVDIKEPKRYTVYLGQAGLGLPDRDYYLKPDFAAKKEKYQAYAAQLLRLLDWPEAEKRATEVVEFETKIADASWTKTQQRDPVATYNAMSLAELEKLAPNFAWRPFLAQAGLDKAERVVVAEKSAFPKIAEIFEKTPIETLQAWQAFNIADHAAPYLSKGFVDALFEMRNKTLSGQAEQRVRWKRGVHAVGGGDYGTGDRYDRFGNLGWAVGELYSAKYFPPAAKAKIEELVANLKVAMHERIKALDWMGEETKARALKKLDTYNIKVGYPDKTRDHSKVQIRADDLVGNVVRTAAADWAFYVNRLAGPVDMTDWGMTPQTNDAYNGALRDIVFPAGILQPPMFDANADPAINYGAIGGVIGHELTHGFDDQGRKFDAEGKLNDWWTAEDAKTFEARAKVLGEQYEKFEPLPGAKVNGELTMGENIADLGGVVIALDAYRASLKGKPAPVIDGLSGEQRVFLGWAQAWRGKLRDDAIRRQVVSDPHSPRQYRVNGVVRNIDAWYEAFKVKPDEKLFIETGSRVRIW
ncbi:MAG TPA: M13 family metallopeptidase [Chthoniobacterales bacterium]|jgi:putative endopeptidase|nr:M13 family metallopeptidase [Chthoniobacterales bacterium]